MEDVTIHPSATVASGAQLGKGVFIGPYCLIGKDVTIGDYNRLHSHVVCDGHVRIGHNNQFFPFCSIGAPPQDFSYKGEATLVEIGDDNTFREYVSVHRGTLKEDRVTKVGKGCFLMNSVHIGHDAAVGDDCTFASSVLLGGHAKVGKGVFIGGGSALEQFVFVGEGAYIGGMSTVSKDVPSHCCAYGNRAVLVGVNIVGMRRKSFPREHISGAVKFFRAMKSSELAPSSFVEDGQFVDNPVIRLICHDIRQSKKGVTPLRRSCG